MVYSPLCPLNKAKIETFVLIMILLETIMATGICICPMTESRSNKGKATVVYLKLESA